MSQDVAVTGHPFGVVVAQERSLRLRRWPGSRHGPSPPARSPIWAPRRGCQRRFLSHHQFLCRQHPPGNRVPRVLVSGHEAACNGIAENGRLSLGIQIALVPPALHAPGDQSPPSRAGASATRAETKSLAVDSPAGPQVCWCGERLFRILPWAEQAIMPPLKPVQVPLPGPALVVTINVKIRPDGRRWRHAGLPHRYR